jgi:Mn-dependent DtxR family transcriptional regulator
MSLSIFLFLFFKIIKMSRILSISQEHELLQKLESAGLNSDVAQKVITSKGNNLAKKVVDFLKNEIGILKNVIKISDFFGHQIADQIPQWMSDTFLTKVFNPYKDMEITLPEVLPILNEYVLPRNMSDSKIQENTSSKPMSLEEYYLARYILLISGKADKSKVYLFHVQVGNEVLALYLYWYGDSWNSHDWSFGRGDGWGAADRVCSIGRSAL